MATTRAAPKLPNSPNSATSTNAAKHDPNAAHVLKGEATQLAHVSTGRRRSGHVGSTHTSASPPEFLPRPPMITGTGRNTRNIRLKSNTQSLYRADATMSKANHNAKHTDRPNVAGVPREADMTKPHPHMQQHTLVRNPTGDAAGVRLTHPSAWAPSLSEDATTVTTAPVGSARQPHANGAARGRASSEATTRLIRFHENEEQKCNVEVPGARETCEKAGCRTGGSVPGHVIC